MKQAPGKASNLIAFFERNNGPPAPAVAVPVLSRIRSSSGSGPSLQPPTAPFSHTRTASAPSDPGNLTPPRVSPATRFGVPQPGMAPSADGSPWRAPVAWGGARQTPSPRPLDPPPVATPSQLSRTVTPVPDLTPVKSSAPPPFERQRSNSFLSSLKKRSASPMLGVRNMVAAWRGRNVSTSPSTFGVVPPASQAYGEHKGNKLEEAFFTIRRMSTRRKGKEDPFGRSTVADTTPAHRAMQQPSAPLIAYTAAQAAGTNPPETSHQVERSLGEAQAFFRPETHDQPTGEQAVKGRIVSSFTDIATEVNASRLVRLGS